MRSATARQRDSATVSCRTRSHRFSAHLRASEHVEIGYSRLSMSAPLNLSWDGVVKLVEARARFQIVTAP